MAAQLRVPLRVLTTSTATIGPRRVVRVAAAPTELDPRADEDMDYGNSIFNYKGPFTPRMRKPAVVNIRYGRDLDDLSSDERPLHYDFGFNMTGNTPYDMPWIERTDSLRRRPKVTRVIPHERMIGRCRDV